MAREIAEGLILCDDSHQKNTLPCVGSEPGVAHFAHLNRGFAEAWQEKTFDAQRETTRENVKEFKTPTRLPAHNNH